MFYLCDISIIYVYIFMMSIYTFCITFICVFVNENDTFYKFGKTINLKKLV